MSRRARTSLLAACLAVVGLAGAGCDVRAGDGGFSVDLASGRASDEWKRSYTVTAGGRFEVKNINGIGDHRAGRRRLRHRRARLNASPRRRATKPRRRPSSSWRSAKR